MQDTAQQISKGLAEIEQRTLMAFEVVRSEQTALLAAALVRLGHLQRTHCKDERIALCRARIVACNAAIAALNDVLGN